MPSAAAFDLSASVSSLSPSALDGAADFKGSGQKSGESERPGVNQLDSRFVIRSKEDGEEEEEGSADAELESRRRGN